MRMTRRKLLSATLLLLPALAGCQLFATIGILTAPRRIQKAQFHLTKDRLAILIEAARPGEENPVFNRTLHEKLVEIFAQENVNTNIVPYEEMLRLRQRNADFSRWSLQRIGRGVGAEQVLEIRLDRLRLETTADNPVVEPYARAYLKVLAVHEMDDEARLWPPRTERRGYAVEGSRPARETSSLSEVDTEAARFAREFAYVVAAPFYDVDLEDKPPREP